MSQDGVSGPDLVFKLRVVKRGQLALEAVAADPDSSRELAERALARFPKLAMGLASASSSRGRAASRRGVQSTQAPNAQQMSAFALAIVKSSVPRGENSSRSVFENAIAIASAIHAGPRPLA
jgi:hypothetical protein